jgi:hypothetical protein
MPRTSHRDAKPESFWRDLIGRWRASGQSVAAFCAAHCVSQATFYSWRKRLTVQSRVVAAPPQPAPAFAPACVVPDPTAEVVLPSGLIVRVPVSADAAAVARLVTALGGATC